MSQEKKMPETQNLNHENEKPFLTVVSKVTPQDAEKAARYFRLLQSVKTSVIFALFLLAATAVITLINGLPLAAVSTVIRDSRMWIYILLYIGFCGVYHVWYQPRQARRALIEAYGNQPYWETRYSLDSEGLRIEAVGTKTTSESLVRYADIRRIRELKYQILLRTQTHSLLSINKLGMSESDAAALLNGLKEKTKA